MSDLQSLTKRIDTEIAGFKQSVVEFQDTAMSAYEAREARFRDLFVPASKRVVELIRPRLQVLVERFKDRVDIKPVITEHLREVEMRFNSPVAQIDLAFSLTHDMDVKNLILDRRLNILPIFMKFDEHSGLTMPLDKIDDGKIAEWFDDRVVSFVQTLKELHQNNYYQKGHLVTDPIAGVQMPKYAARTTLAVDGKTYYFISDETRSEFEKQRATAGK